MLNLLVVEDEEVIRKGFIHTINWTEMDCKVVGEACNGEEGLEKIKRLKPDVVITDIIMPKLTGIEMIEAAKRESEYPFKTIFLTSYSEFDYAKKAIELKVDEYLLKPIDEEEVAKIMAKLKKEIYEERAYYELLERAKDKSDMKFSKIDIYIDFDKKHNYYVQKALELIRDNYAKKMSIEGIADTLGVSASYMSRKFKEEMGQTFLDVLHRYRIQKAMELLQKGHYKLYEISDLTGFSDYKHFCSVFKKYVQLAPSEFIKKDSVIIQRCVIQKR